MNTGKNSNKLNYLETCFPLANIIYIKGRKSVAVRRRGNGRITGLVLLSMGVGMFIVLLLPWWGFLLAAFLAVYGFWRLFLCR